MFKKDLADQREWYYEMGLWETRLYYYYGIVEFWNTQDFDKNKPIMGYL